MRSLLDLATAISDRAKARRAARVSISPDEAPRIADALRAYMARPKRDDVVKIVCPNNCHPERRVGCYPCTGKANIIDHMYKGDGDPFGGEPGLKPMRTRHIIKLVSGGKR